MKDSFETFGYKLANIAGVWVLALIVLAFAPLCIIWSLNTLFPVLDIPMNFYTWLSILILSALFTSRGKAAKN